MVKIFLRFGIYFRVSGQVGGYFVGSSNDILAASSLEVAAHGLIVAKGRGCSSYLSPHVTNSTLTSTRERLSTFAEVFHNSTCTPLYGKDISYFEDYVLRGSPSVELTGEFDPDELREF